MENQKDNIVLSSDRVSTQKRAGELTITHKAAYQYHFWLHCVCFIPFLWLSGTSFLNYLNLEEVKQEQFDSELEREETEIQAYYQTSEKDRHEQLQRDLIYKLDTEISEEEMHLLRARVLGEDISAIEEETKLKIEQLKKQKIRIEEELDSFKKAGSVAPLSQAELDKRTQKWRDDNNHLLEINSGEFESGVIWPIGTILLILILAYFSARSFLGDDVLIVNKQRQIITIHKNKLRKPRTISTSDITQFFCIQIGHRYPTYQIKYVTKQGVQEILLSGMESSKTFVTIETEIENFLEIEHVNVRGSIS